MMHVSKSDIPYWLARALDHLQSAPEGLDAEGWGQRIHEALQLCEVEKYATPESRFTFSMAGATEDDIREIRRYLTPLENSIVSIQLKP